MPTNLKMADAGVNAEAIALTQALNNGFLRIYDGVQPASGDAAPTANEHLLAELRFAASSFAPPAAGVITASPMQPVAAILGGTATWFRALKSDGSTPVMDGNVGTSGANLNLNSVQLTQNAQVSINSFVHTVTK